MSCATLAGSLISFPQYDASALITAPTDDSYSGSKTGVSLFARTPQFVRIPPGSRVHTLTPKAATSCASDSVNPPTAHLAAWYPVLPGRARRPPTEEICRMQPLF